MAMYIAHSVLDDVINFRETEIRKNEIGGHFRFGGPWKNLSVPPPVYRTSILAPNLRRAGQIRNLEALKSDFWWIQTLENCSEVLIICVMGESV